MPNRTPVFEQNVERVVKLAQDASERRSLTTKIGARLTSGFGTMASVILHLLAIAGWCLVNSGWLKELKPFDPYPFNLLTLIVSFESVLIALFVLLTQNRMSREADLRAHLNLQMGILIEQEMTAVLQLTKKLVEREGLLEAEEEVEQLLEQTDIEQLADELEKKLPQES